jgi:hypothetical protein
MKKLLIISIISISFLSSCVGDCDTSTAEGAANCLCGLTDDSMILDQTDETKTKEFSDKIIKVNTEIKEAIDAGNYTKEELAVIAGERGCM